MPGLFFLYLHCSHDKSILQSIYLYYRFGKSGEWLLVLNSASLQLYMYLWFNLTKRAIKFQSIKSLFVCVGVLRPGQPNGVMSSMVNLPNHRFTGQA